MNYYDAKQIRDRAIAGEPVNAQSLASANEYMGRSKHAPVVARPRPMQFAANVPYDALCECGQRYGMHRVKDYACPNQQWRPGNGQAQWLGKTFARAA